MDAAGEFLFGASDLNTLDLPLPIAGHAKMGTKGTQAEGLSHHYYAHTCTDTYLIIGGYGSFVTAFENALVLLPIRSRLGRYMWPLAELSGDKAKPHRKEIDFWIQVSSNHYTTSKMLELTKCYIATARFGVCQEGAMGPWRRG